MRQSGRVHALTAVAYRYHRILSGLDREVELRPCFLQFDIEGFDLQFSAARHRIDRIDDQVHDHLFELAAIRLHSPEFRMAPDSELNVFADRVKAEWLSCWR